MRLLYVAPSVDPAQGGVAEAVRSLGVAQRELGLEVEVVSLDDPGAPYVASYPLTLHALGTGRGGYGYEKRFVSRLRELAKKFDAVIVHGLWQYSTLAVWRALRTSGPPYFVFPHGMLDPWFRRAYPLKHLKKWFYWTLLERRVLRDARAVLFTCEEERRLARQTFWLYRCREETVGLGCATPALEPGRQTALFFERFPELRGRRLLLFLGRLHDKKGCDLLIRAFGEMQAKGRAAATTLVMAGPPSSEAYSRTLQRLAAERCAEDSVVFPGMLEGDLKWGAFQAAEVFVLPSHQENFGLAVVEALACGCPVLISKQINIWREIEAEGAGFMEADDLMGTLRLLERWENASADTRSEMADAARRAFTARFEIHAAAARLTETVERSLAQR